MFFYLIGYEGGSVVTGGFTISRIISLDLGVDKDETEIKRSK